MIATIRSEFTKFLTLPTVWIMTAVILAIFFFLQYSVFGDHISMVQNVGPDGMADGTHVETEISQVIGVTIFNAGLLMPVLGAMIAGTEFRAGQLGLSFVAVPNRTRLIIGKVFATTIYAVALSIVCILIASILAFIAVKDWKPELLWSPEMMLAHGRLLLYMITSTLMGLGLTLLTRRTLTGIIIAVVLMMLGLARIVAMISSAVDSFVPLSAARNLLLQNRDAGPPLTGSAESGALVLIIWAVVVTIIAVIMMKRKDAR